jgi:hypothetical protein
MLLEKNVVRTNIGRNFVTTKVVRANVRVRINVHRAKFVRINVFRSSLIKTNFFYIKSC